MNTKLKKTLVGIPINIDLAEVPAGTDRDPLLWTRHCSPRLRILDVPYQRLGNTFLRAEIMIDSANRAVAGIIESVKSLILAPFPTSRGTKAYLTEG